MFTSSYLDFMKGRFGVGDVLPNIIGSNKIHRFVLCRKCASGFQVYLCDLYWLKQVWFAQGKETLDILSKCSGFLMESAVN